LAAVIRLRGATSGYTEITVPDVAADNAIQLPQSGTVLASQEYVQSQIQASDTLSELNDVSIPAPSAGDALIYNGSTWGSGQAGAAFLEAGSDTINISLSSDKIISRDATGDITFTGSDYTAGKSATVSIFCDGTNRNLTFPAGWLFVTFKPTSLDANQVGILSLTSFGTTESRVVAGWSWSA
jgi:hypothetical protein